MASDKLGVSEETVVTVMVGKYLHRKFPPCSTLEMYNEMPIFIPVSITEGGQNYSTKTFGEFGPRWKIHRGEF